MWKKSDMSASFNYYSDPVLPWTSTRNDERFIRIAKWVLILFIAIGIIIPWLPSPEAEKKPLKQVAPRLAKLITEKRLQKVPPPPVKNMEKKIVKKKIKPEVKSKKIEKAQLKAKQSGLMAMSKDIQDLQSMFDVSALDSVKPLRSNSATSKTTKQSSVLSGNATKSSGGIDTTKLSRSTASSALEGRKSSNVSSNIDTLKSRTPRQTRAGINTRPEQELQLVFDRYKGSLEAIYMRTLRKDPTLQGKVIFELTINPSGKVTSCRIISSELNSKALESRLVSRIKSFQFSNQNVETVTVTYPVDFLPS